MELLWPTQNQRITQRFGVNKNVYPYGLLGHRGLDLGPIRRGVSGDSLYAVADGLVTKVQYNHPAYGHHLYLLLENGYKVLYGHCERVFVKEGQAVEMGTTVAEMGNSGVSTAPHLHLGIRNNMWWWIDPLPYLQISNMQFMSMKEDIAFLKKHAVTRDKRIVQQIGGKHDGSMHVVDHDKRLRYRYSPEEEAGNLALSKLSLVQMPWRELKKYKIVKKPSDIL